MEGIDKVFEVAASVEHAFEVWTARTGMWWPRSHTMGGDRHERIVFEREAGGRIYERTVDGEEHEWGEVVAWEPPHRVEYLWHLFFDRSEATTVEVTFTGLDGATRVRIRQSGFERLGAPGQVRRDRTDAAWDAITGLYRAAV
jgi:uncharacterized protein YndB with AHSA1/START domain